MLKNYEEKTQKIVDSLKLPMDNFYEEYQWSPANIDGKKYYTRDQLLSLRNLKASTATDYKPKLSCLMKVNLMPAFAQNFQFPTSGMGQSQNQQINRPKNKTSNVQHLKTSESNRKGMSGTCIYYSLSFTY